MDERGIPTANVTDERHDSNRYRESTDPPLPIYRVFRIIVFSSMSLETICRVRYRSASPFFWNNKKKKAKEKKGNDARNDDRNRSTCSNIDINESHATLLPRGLRSRTSLKFPPTFIPTFLRPVVSYSPNGKGGGHVFSQISCAKIKNTCPRM